MTMNENPEPKKELERIEVSNVKELEQTLLSMETYIIKIAINDRILRFTKEDHGDITYYVQRTENEFYGLVFYKGAWIYSYPHMKNIRTSTQFTLENCNLEEKINGTNIGVGRYKIPGEDEIDIVRTRMSPFPTEFPVSAFWNSTISGMINKDIADRVTEIRTDMLERHPDWFVYAGEGEYVGLKVQEVVRKLIDVKGILDVHPEYNFHFELIGKCNPIIIDSELEFGMYGFDIKLILIDVFDKRTRSFLNRDDKEKVAKDLSLSIIPVRFSFRTIEDLRHSIDGIKKYAETYKIEGFVIKNNAEIVKVKPDTILQSAYRINAILKGHIFTPDLVDYISKIVNMESLSKPEEFDNLVMLIAEEAKADYEEEIIENNMGRIRKIPANEMALMITIQILKEQSFESKDEMFKFINSEIPKRFEPLKTYIDFEAEKTTTDLALARRMKSRRKDLMKKVVKYCIKHWEL